MKEAVLCIGAGKAQYPIISKSKELGYKTIAIDRDDNAPGFQIADEKICISTFNIEPVLGLIKSFSNKYKIKGILNRSSGPPVVTAATLAENLKVPCYTKECAQLIINKHKLLTGCQKIGINVPESIVLSNSQEYANYNITYPAVVKPSLSLVGKSGVSFVKDQNDLPKAIKNAFQATINKNIIVSEYYEGKDASLISFVDEGELIPICFVDELNIIDLNGKIEGWGFAIPSLFELTDVYKKILLICKDIVRELKIERSPFIVSFRIDTNLTPYLIEIHLDLGGDLLIEELFPKAFKFDFLEYSIQLLSGEKPKMPNNLAKPTVIIFEKGEKLVSDKKTSIYQASTRKELDVLIRTRLEQ